MSSNTIIDTASPETNSTLEEKRLIARRRFLLGAVAPIIVTVNARRAFAATGLLCGSVDPAFFFDSPFIQGLIDLFGGDSSNLPISCFCGKMEPGEVISGSTDFLACLEKSTLPPP